jgi:hypothetical protein
MKITKMVRNMGRRKEEETIFEDNKEDGERDRQQKGEENLAGS